MYARDLCHHTTQLPDNPLRPPINVIHAVNERFPAIELVHDIRANTPEIMGVRCRR